MKIRKPVITFVGIFLCVAAAVAQEDSTDWCPTEWNTYRLHPLEISRETTYITQPLASNGLPNYSAWLQQQAPSTENPDENLASVLVDLMEGDEYDAAHIARLRALKGVASTRQTTVRFERGPAWHADDEFAAQLKQAMTRSWTNDELPGIAQWLDKNEPAIDLLESQLSRPVLFAPESGMRFEALPENNVLFLNGMIGNWLRNLSDGMAASAMRLAGDGRLPEAIRRIESLSVLAQRLNQHNDVFRWSVQKEIHLKSFGCVLGVSRHPKISEPQLLQLQNIILFKDIGLSAADIVDGYYRGRLLDSVCHSSLYGYPAFCNCLELNAKDSWPMDVAFALADWDQIAIDVNALCDQWVTIREHRKPSEIKAAFADADQAYMANRTSLQPSSIQIQREVNRYVFHGPLHHVHSWGLLPLSSARFGADYAAAMYGAYQLNTKHLSNLIRGTVEFAAAQVFETEFERVTQRALLATAIATRRFQRDHQRLPGKLEQLVPDYLAQLPADQLQVNAIRFVKTGDGYYLITEPYFENVRTSREVVETAENWLNSDCKDNFAIRVDKNPPQEMRKR